MFCQKTLTFHKMQKRKKKLKCLDGLKEGLPWWLSGKESTCNAGDSRDVSKIPWREGMATYSSISPWRIPWTEEPGRLQFIGSQKSQTRLKGLSTHVHTWFNTPDYSVQFSHSIMSNSLWSHGQQHTRLPCPSPTPGACSNSCPSSRWCHPTISSSVVPFSSCLQSFLASESFPKSQFFTSGGQTIWSFSFSISPYNEYSGLISFTIDWLDLLAVQRTLKSLLQHHSWKESILQCSAFFTVQLSHPYMTTGQIIALTTRTFVGKVTSLLFKTPSRLAIAFLPKSKHLLISWLQSPSAVILELKKIKSLTVSTVSPSICHEWWDWMPWS